MIIDETALHDVIESRIHSGTYITNKVQHDAYTLNISCNRCNGYLLLTYKYLISPAGIGESKEDLISDVIKAFVSNGWYLDTITFDILCDVCGSLSTVYIGNWIYSFGYEDSFGNIKINL